jgi:Fic family protein
MIPEKLLKRIYEKKRKLDSFRPLDKILLKKLKDDYLIEYVYNSTSIEGNTLTLNETKLVLLEGITIGGKHLREHLDVTNQKEAFLLIEKWINKKKKLDIIDILFLHRVTLKGISDYWAGKFKTSQNRIVGSRLKTTPPYKIAMEMKEFVRQLNKNDKKYNPIELAAYAHHEFVRIHPFVDGNGRTARLLTNLILLKNGYVPIVIRNKDKKKYFDCLEKAHFGKLNVFVGFIARMVEESMIRYLEVFSKTTKENELLPLSEFVKETSYSQEYLSLLARQGKLAATKINNVWHTSREEIRKYMDFL